MHSKKTVRRGLTKSCTFELRVVHRADLLVDVLMFSLIFLCFLEHYIRSVLSSALFVCSLNFLARGELCFWHSCLLSCFFLVVARSSAVDIRKRLSLSPKLQKWFAKYSSSLCASWERTPLPRAVRFVRTACRLAVLPSLHSRQHRQTFGLPAL